MSAGARRGRQAHLLVAAALLSSAHLGFAQKAIPQKKWGDAQYSVQLMTITTTGGELTPSFTPEHQEYTVAIHDYKPKQVGVRLLLDMSKYFVDEPPDILVNGEEWYYNPTQEMIINVLLNSTIGPEDKPMTIKLRDPKAEGGLFFMHHSNEFEYKIRFLQPPEFDKITMPFNMTVRDQNGTLMHVMKDTPTFKYMDKVDTKFKYSFNETFTSATIILSCPTVVATGISEQVQDGQIAGPTAPYVIDLTEIFMERVNVMCQYHDDRWVLTPMTQGYQFLFSRHVVEDEPLKAQFMLVAPSGSCEQIDDPVQHPEYFQGWQGDYNLCLGRGFVCRHLSDTVTGVALLHHQSVVARVVRQKDLSTYQMKANVDRDLPLSEIREFYSMQVTAGDRSVTYPVLFMKVDHCTSLPLPSDKAYRTADDNNLISEMCMGVTCQESDRSWCIVPKDRCSNYLFGCPAAHKTVDNPGDVQCVEALCTELLDQGTCCSLVTTTTTNTGTTFTTTFHFPEYKKDDPVVYKGKKAVVYARGVDAANGENHVDIVLEATGELIGPISAEDVQNETSPTFLVGEQVLVHHMSLAGVVEVFRNRTVMVKYNDTNNIRGPLANTIVSKCAECFLHPTVSENITYIESKPDEMYYEVDYKYDTTLTNNTRCEKLMNEWTARVAVSQAKEKDLEKKVAVAKQKNQGKDATDNKAQSEDEKALKDAKKNAEEEAPVCTPDIIHETQVKRQVFAVEDIVVVEDNNATLQRGQRVVVNGKDGLIEHICGLSRPCYVSILKEKETVGPFNTSEIQLKDGFVAGEEVYVDGKLGVVVGPCGGSTICTVEFLGGAIVGKHEGRDTFNVSGLKREEGFLMGQPVIVNDRKGKITTTCMGDTMSKCEVEFTDGNLPSSEGNLRFGDIVKQSVLIPGQPVEVDGHSGYITDRRPRAAYRLEFADDRIDPHPPPGSTDGEGQQHIMEEGHEPPYEPELLHEKALLVNHEWSYIFPIDGSPIDTNDMADRPLHLGERVVVGKRSALISEINDDHTFKVMFQTTGLETGLLVFEQLNTQVSRVMTDDRVSVYGSSGTVTAIGRFYGHSFQVTFDDGGTSGPLTFPEIKQLQQTFKTGDVVVVNKNTSVVTSKDETLDAYYVSHGSLVSGPWKGYQMMSKSQMGVEARTFHVGDEVVAYGVKGIVKSGPDNNGMYRITFFRDGGTSYSVDGGTLDDANSKGSQGDSVNIHDYPLPTFVMRHRAGDFVLGDKVECHGLQGVVIKLMDPDDEMKYTVRYATGEDRKESGDDLTISYIESQMALRVQVGDEVTVDNREAYVNFGPDNDGKFMVIFMTTGQTAGPFEESELQRTYHVGEEVLVQGHRAIIMTANTDGTYQVAYLETLMAAQNGAQFSAKDIQCAVSARFSKSKRISTGGSTASRLPHWSSEMGFLAAAALVVCVVFRPAKAHGVRRLWSSFEEAQPSMCDTSIDLRRDDASDAMLGLYNRGDGARELE